METFGNAKTLMTFLNQGVAKPVTSAEFLPFWKACSEEEHNEFASQARSLMEIQPSPVPMS